MTTHLIQPPTECTTSTHYAIHISPECSPGGSAQCEGYCESHTEECSCGCHRDHWMGDDYPRTVQEMQAWHDEYHGVTRHCDGTITEENQP